MKFRCVCLIGLLMLIAGSAQGRVLQQFTDRTLPASLTLPTAGIFLHSDTLRLNGRLLSRSIDYTIDLQSRYIDVSQISLNSEDTLVVSYHEVPLWAASVYGRELPDASVPQSPIPIPVDLGESSRPGNFAKDIRISGAKTFRFSSRTAGEADFGQSLDLRINGELSPGLELTGALTDRGYDPSYGTSTSRLNELDKLNLQLKSRVLLAQLGDITLPREFGGNAKTVSGGSVRLIYPTWQMQASAARPKGRFQSTSMSGQDRFQGPYRMGGSQASSPVVPGSEIVWLDGQRMERGADKDYTVDYPSGQITFSVRHPIDRRSRIEIDFEPLATSYRQEMLTLGGGVNIRDSLLTVSASVYREGDDRNQMLIGELSDIDRQMLEESGDADGYRSGVVADSAGDYRLVTDSLPDTVWTYVGMGNGDYHVTFSYLGSGVGSYRYVGGQSYQYVGNGQGDYAPIRILPRPERIDLYASRIGLKTGAGNLAAEFRQTSRDRNLLSSRDDGDNDGLYYFLNYVKDWRMNGAPSSVNASRRLREAAFASRERLVEPDFARSFLLPDSWISQSDELTHSAQMSFSPISGLTIAPQFSRLTYQDKFQSTLGGLGVEMKPFDRLTIGAEVRSVSTEFDTSGIASDGSANTYSSSAAYRFGAANFLKGTFESDSRQHRYTGSERGLRFNRWELTAGSPTESIRLERYDEDSLETDWFGSGSRDRISALSNRQIRNLSISSEIGWQRLTDRVSRTSYLLGRSSLSYSDSRRRLQTQASYLISNELRNERGISYLEVEPGRGNYSFEDGKYIPDPFGNYIQVEELLSDRASVRRGEKSFLFNKEFTGMTIRLSSNIREELLDEGKRPVWWVIPFYSDETQPYLLFSRRYDSELRFFQWKNFYAVNITLTDDLEKRSIAGSGNRRRDSRGSVSLKQAAGNFLLEETGELFRSERDDYYIGAGTAEGIKGSAMIRQLLDRYEWNSGAAVRRAKSTEQDRADQYALLVGVRVRSIGKGELRADLELYRQSLTLRSSSYSYELTDNRNGKRGAIWTVGLRYGIRQGLQANLNFSGRHSDDRPGRVSGRGEVVATF